jgi:hypothetical protein
MVAFDWYQATVRAEPEEVLGTFLDASIRGSLRHTKGVQGYRTCTKVEADDGRLGEVEVWHGGNHVHPHVRLTSDAAAWGVGILREAFPVHSVVRVDVKQDYAAADAFDRMLPTLLEAARRHRLRVDSRGDHFVRKQARTVYLGSPQSAVRVRQYDKAAELRAKFARDPVRLAQVPDSLTRLEVQVRPAGTLARSACASQEARAFMGVSAATRDIWQAIEGEQLEPVHVTKAWRQSDDERAYTALLAQYGGLLQRLQEDLGSWDMVGRQIGSDLVERSQAKQGARR